MTRVIDTPWNTTAHLPKLRSMGVRTIIRYYNHRNSTRLPEKRLEPAEAQAIADEGMSLCTVFQQRGGADGNIQDLDAQSGRDDARRALDLADRIGQPDGSAIYFAVDHDYYKTSQLASIRAYFDAAANVVNSRFRIGVYGSGKVARTVLNDGSAEFVWLAAASGWSGTKDMLKTSDWALFQQWPPKDAPLNHDENIVSPAWPNYGQFIPGGADQPDDQVPNVVLMEVIARGGLNLRRGPGIQYAVERTLAKGVIVRALDTTRGWVLVDLDGDGQADGYLHGNFLKIVSGGFPIMSAAFDNAPLSLVPPTPPTPVSSETPDTPTAPGTPPTPFSLAASHLSPYDIARRELELDVREVPGPGNNPRIVMYHNSTGSSQQNQDSVPWCSSFVNYCVEQAGIVGTDSKWALTWDGWGQDAGGSPQTGDIAVFERVGKGGHVGFVVEDLPNHVKLLGGNQNDRVKISTYPKDGKIGSTHYKLRSFRRA